VARNDALAKLYNQMVARREELRKSLLGDMSNMGNETAEAGSFDDGDAAFESQQNDVCSTLAQFESAELQKLDRVISRFREGKYGICEACNKGIPLARLNALPFTVKCIECQREADSGFQRPAAVIVDRPREALKAAMRAEPKPIRPKLKLKAKLKAKAKLTAAKLKSKPEVKVAAKVAPVKAAPAKAVAKALPSKPAAAKPIAKAVSKPASVKPIPVRLTKPASAKLAKPAASKLARVPARAIAKGAARVVAKPLAKGKPVAKPLTKTAAKPAAKSKPAVKAAARGTGKSSPKGR
jgi:DnaK suppressor protein